MIDSISGQSATAAISPQPTSSHSHHNQPYDARSIWKIIPLIAAIALATSFAFLARFHDFYTNDSYSYVTAAQNLARGYGFNNAVGYPETIRTPGYPLLIAPFLFFHLDPTYLIVLQHLLRVVIIVATVIVAFRSTCQGMAAIAAGIALCLDLPTIEAANTFMTEILYTAGLGVVLYLLWQTGKRARPWMWSILTGLFLGATTLIRPVGLFFFVPAVIYLLVVRKKIKLRSSLCLVFAFFILPLAWAARNYSRTGSFVLFPISAWDMLGYRAAGVLAINDPGNFNVNVDKRQKELMTEVCDQLRKLYGPDCVPLIVPQTSIVQKAPFYMSVGRHVVLQHPWAYVKLGLRGAAMIMLGGDAVRLAQITGLTRSAAESVLLLYTVPTFCLMLAGAWRLWKDNRSFFYLACLTIVYFVAISAGAEAYSRMRVPIMPLWAILLGSGADRTFQAFSRGATGRRLS